MTFNQLVLVLKFMYSSKIIPGILSACDLYVLTRVTRGTIGVILVLGYVELFSDVSTFIGP
jgi:hypothetical protein